MLPSYLDMIKICFKRDPPVKLRNSVWPSQENGCLHRNMSMYKNNILIRYRHGFDKKSLTGIRMTSVIIRHCCDEAIVTFSCWILPRLFTPWHHPYIWHCIDGFIGILSQREQLRLSWLSVRFCLSDIAAESGVVRLKPSIPVGIHQAHWGAGLGHCWLRPLG